MTISNYKMSVGTAKVWVWLEIRFPVAHLEPGINGSSERRIKSKFQSIKLFKSGLKFNQVFIFKDQSFSGVSQVISGLTVKKGNATADLLKPR